jgi:hypothetical protein
MQATTIVTTKPFFIIHLLLFITQSSVWHFIASIRALRLVKSALLIRALIARCLIRRFRFG